MTVLTRLSPGRPLLRPFLGVGILGGLTTFSSYVVDIQQASLARAWVGKNVVGRISDRYS